MPLVHSAITVQIGSVELRSNIYDGAFIAAKEGHYRLIKAKKFKCRIKKKSLHHIGYFLISGPKKN